MHPSREDMEFTTPSLMTRPVIIPVCCQAPPPHYLFSRPPPMMPCPTMPCSMTPLPMPGHDDGLYIQWQKPAYPYVKINCDGSVCKSGAGCGYILRDFTGSVVAGEAVDLTGPWTSLEVELQAILSGCERALMMGIRMVWIETDSLIAVKYIAGVQQWSQEYDSLLCPILLLLQCFDDWFVSHIYREGNQVADQLAKMGSQGRGLVFWSDPVDEILSFLEDDIMGRLYIRDKKLQQLRCRLRRGIQPLHVSCMLPLV